MFSFYRLLEKIELDIFSKVRDLNLPKGKYTIFGSGPLGIRKLRPSKDVDIVMTPELWYSYKNDTKDWTINRSNLGSDFLVNKDGIELYKNWKPGRWNVKELIRTSDTIDGLSFVSLDNVLKWKKMISREKDLDDIKLINNYTRGK